MGANPSPCRCPILAQPGRGPTTAKSPSVDDWTCDFQGVRVKHPRSPWANGSSSARLGKHPIAGRMVSTLNRYELAACGSSTFDSTDSRALGFHSCRASENRTFENFAGRPEARLNHSGTCSCLDDLRRTCRLREVQRIKQIVRLRISSCEVRQLEDVPNCLRD